MRAIVLAALAAMSAPSAWAGDTACLWGALPQEARDKVLAEYAARGVEGAMAAGVPVTTVVVAADKCTKIPEDQAEQRALLKVLERVFFGASLEQAAASTLKSTRQMSDADLDRAWAGLIASDRAAVIAAIAGNRFSRESLTAMTLSAQAAGWLQDPTFTSPNQDPTFFPFRDYFFGRALRETEDGKF